MVRNESEPATRPTPTPTGCDLSRYGGVQHSRVVRLALVGGYRLPVGPIPASRSFHRWFSGRPLAPVA